MKKKLNNLMKLIKWIVNPIRGKTCNPVENKWSKKQHAHHRSVIKQKRFEKALFSNPYLQSKAMWNDLYGSIQTKLENSYRIIFVLAIAIILAVIGFIIIAGETKVKPIPFIIHGDEILTVSNHESLEFQELKPMLSLYFSKKFIRYARTVSVDGVVNANNKIGSLSFVTGSATQVITDFYEQNDPDKIAERYVKNITITSVLRNSPHSLDIRWIEDWRSVHSGELIQSQHYIAQVTYRYQAPSENETILQNNPLGFYVTHLSWSLDQNS